MQALACVLSCSHPLLETALGCRRCGGIISSQDKTLRQGLCLAEGVTHTGIMVELCGHTYADRLQCTSQSTDSLLPVVQCAAPERLQRAGCKPLDLELLLLSKTIPKIKL